MILDTDRTDRFGQALFDALLDGFDHAWARATFDDEPLDPDGGPESEPDTIAPAVRGGPR